MAFSLTDLATLKEALGVKPAATNEDATLTRLIPIVSSQIASLTNRVDGIEQIERTETKDVRRRQRWFRMKAAPIVSVSLVEYDPANDFVSPTILDTSNFIIKPNTGEIYLHLDLVSTLFGAGHHHAHGSGGVDHRRVMVAPQSLRITYIGGLGTDLAGVRAALPELEHFCIEWIKIIWKRKRTNPQRISISGQGGSITVEDMALPPEIRDGLRRIRRPNVG